jgi:hypothetical protein
MTDNATTWDDLLANPQQPSPMAVTAATPAATKNAKAKVGWDDILSAPPAPKATPPTPQPAPSLYDRAVSIVPGFLKRFLGSTPAEPEATQQDPTVTPAGPAPNYADSQDRMQRLERQASQQEADQYLAEAGARAGQQAPGQDFPNAQQMSNIQAPGQHFGTISQMPPPSYLEHLSGVFGPDTVLGRIARRAVGRTDVAPPDLISNAAALPIIGPHVIKPLAEGAGMTVGEPEPLMRFSPMPGSIADFPEARAVTRFATSMTQPEQLALIGGIGKLTGIPAAAVQTYFSGQMGAGALQNLAEINDALKRGDTDRARELAVEAGLNTWFAAEAGRGAVEGGRSIAEGRKTKAQETVPQPEESPAAAQEIPQPPQTQAGIPSGRDVSWEDVLRRPAQAAPQETGTQPGPQLTHPAGEVTGIDEATGLPIVRRPQNEPAQPQQAAETVQAPQEAPQRVSEPAGQQLKGWDDLLPQSPRQPVAFRGQQETPGEYGAASAVKTPTSDIPAKYKLVEASDLEPSHDAETFAPNPNFPPGVQERAYQTSKEAQNRVIQQAQNYDPRYTVNNNPDAVNGPPIVTPDGTVLGGNSRTMSTQRLYARGEGDTYRDYLRDNAQQFGLSPEAVDKMQNPMLVREIPAPADLEGARRLSSELNKNMTGALGTSERAASAGKSITPASLSQISSMLDELGPDSSIRDLLRGRGRDVLSLLTRDGAITERERPQFVDTATGGLSEEGKQFAERALLGTVVDDPTLMDRAPKSVLNKLDGSLADIASIAPRTDEYNLLPLVREALAEHADIAARGLDVETHLAQQGMFGPERNPAVDAIVRKLAEKPKQVREAFRSFARDANADKPGQGFLAMGEPPNAAQAFNEAFGSDLTQTQYEQAALQSLEREAAKGNAYATQPTAPAETRTPYAGVRPESAETARGRATTRNVPNRPGAQGNEQPALLPEGSEAPVGGTLFAHTPVSVAKLALDRLNNFYDEKVAEPVIQNVIKTGRTHPEVEKADPELAENLRLLDNAPKYFRQKAQAIIRNVTAGLDRGQERLFTLMADADSRENLRTNHPGEYRQAQSDPAIQAALKKYKPEETKLTEARKALGGDIIDDDYLRRVYDKYTAGINQRDTGGKGLTAYDRVIRPQKADKLGREAEAEYHYQNGLHEFGPAFGTKYVATMIKVARDRAAREFLSKATAVEQGDYLPRQIDYNGKTYYAPEVAREMHEAGKGKVETYGTYSPTPSAAKPAPQRNLSFAANRYLGPRAVTDALNGLDATGPGDPSAIKRFFQEQTVGLGFGVPHMFNIMRRVTQSAPGGAINPVGWARALKVAFSRELKARGISGVDDPTFDRLAKFGAISRESEVSSFKKFIGGNLNPANWIRPFSKIGHDILFKPGALDQRARLYIGDLVKSQHPEFSDSRIAQTVNEQLGNYNRANWTKMQTQISKFVLFPGWDMSSLNWVIRHPIKTSVPPALLIWTANRAINSMGGNRESEKNDFFAIHAGNRAYNTGLINEPLGRAAGGTALRFAQALVEGKSPTRAVGEASRGVATDLTRPLGMLRPDVGGAIELGTNRERIGGSKEIYKASDFSTPGRVLPNVGLEKLAMHALTRILPQAERVSQAADSTGKWDPARFVGGNLGVSNYPVDAESRLRKKMATAMNYSQSKSAVLKQNPQAVKELFTNDPDAAVYLAFRPHMQQSLGQLKKIDQAKEIISSNSAETPERKQAAITALDQARAQEVMKADKTDQAVDLVLQRVHQRHGTGLPNLPALRVFQQQRAVEPTAP